MKCPECGAAELERDTRDHTYSYKGQTTTIAAVTADYCPACNESLTMLEESDRVIAAMRAFAKQINSSLVDPV
jgi:HTH-type transcriptional regulator/antitoxin MqsA